MKKYLSLIGLTSVALASSLGAVSYRVNPLDARNILEEAYSSIWNAGFLIPDTETEFIKANKGAPTYGEIVWDSAQELFEELKLTKKDVVYDLGCGTGKFVAQAYLQTPARKVVGVDLSKTRLRHAQTVQEGIIEQAQKVLGKKFFKKKKWELRHENILETDVDDATVVYMCSTCYSDELMDDITERLADTCKDGLRVLSLKQLPFHESFKLIKTFTLPMTWSSGSPVYYYKLDKSRMTKRKKTTQSVTVAQVANVQSEATKEVV